MQVWGLVGMESEQQNAFEAIKQVIMTLPVLTYFDKTKKNTIQCNASTINIQHYTPESWTAIASRAAELKKVQDSVANPYSTNKTAGKLQTDHGPRKTNTGTTVRQEH